MGALDLIKGKPGKPSHPPLTDASIGAYAAGVVMLVLGALGVEEEQMAHGALLAISVGLALALPTALTGLLDWLDLPRDTPVRRVATIHLFVMVTATVLFAVTWIAQLGGYKDDGVRGLALVLGLVAFAALAVGGNIAQARGRAGGEGAQPARGLRPRSRSRPTSDRDMEHRVCSCR